MNVTMPTHLLYPGTVTREVVRDGNNIGVLTSGGGTGPLGETNELMALHL